LVVIGHWSLVRGSWFVVRGSWFVVRGSWFVEGEAEGGTHVAVQLRIHRPPTNDE
jgi:hypothetical protein